MIIDGKGDHALFHATFDAMSKRRRDLGITDPKDPRFSFRWFTPEMGRSSFAFNPFDNLTSDTRSDAQFCQLLLDAFNLRAGTEYGRLYYSLRARSALLSALKSAGKPASFEELESAILESVKGDDKAQVDAFSLIAIVKSLRTYRAPCSSTPRAIHLYA